MNFTQTTAYEIQYSFKVIIRGCSEFNIKYQEEPWNQIYIYSLLNSMNRDGIEHNNRN